MAELKPCPFCGGPLQRTVLTQTIDRIHTEGFCEVCRMHFEYDQHFAFSNAARITLDESFEHLWNRRAKIVSVRPEPDLTGKCGSCKSSIPAHGYFGKSTCYVECTNKDHLSSRHYYGNSLIAIRQRTTRACKHYERREDNGT